MLPKKFDPSYYDQRYFAVPKGKKFKRPNGSVGEWSYGNPTGEWLGCQPIVRAWKDIFKPESMLDVGGGRGTFVAYARDEGIEAYCMDFSKWAIVNHYPRCRHGWLKVADARFIPCRDNVFDLVTCLDTMEHIYEEDVSRVLDEIYRVTRRFAFFEIACVGGGSGAGSHFEGYALKRGEPVPVELEGYAVAGHVTVQPKSFWEERFMERDWWFREDLVNLFRMLVPEEVLKNWLTLFVLEKTS